VNALELSRWAASGLFGLLFLLLAATNLHVMFVVPRRLPAGQRGPSPVPILGGFFGAIGCLSAPENTVRWLAWLPLLLDPGCLFLVWSAVRAIRREADETLVRADNAAVAELRHAATGCLLGTAVGDALGLAGEGMSRRRLRRIFPDTSRYHLLFGRGLCSDDTEHACLTAQAFLAAQQNRTPPCPIVFGQTLAASLRWWLVGLPAGVGWATGRAIAKLWLGWPPEKSGVRSAGNGPAMRAPILGVVLGDDLPRLREFIRVSTRLTHTDPRAEHGALAVALAAHLSARSRRTSAVFDPNAVSATIAEILDPGATELRALILSAGASAARGEKTEDFAITLGCGHGVSGYSLHTVPVALQAWFTHPTDLPAALSAVIRCGGDTDSTAAIVGGVVGASVGRAGIPPHLLNQLWEWPRDVRWMERLGAMLGATQDPSRIAFPIGLNLPGLIARNVLFLGIVLTHGFRRLLPPY
jgi:ADP-ribosyl-[dinitrogen reductase] hydrolase